MSADQYKRHHRPQVNAKTHQGYYKIDNPQKYIGNPELCIYRSGWEYSFFRYCDASPSILRWSAEPISLPYYSRTGNLEENFKMGLDPNNVKNWSTKNYHVDVWIEQDKGAGEIERIFVEIKPAHQLKRPIPPPPNASLKFQKRFVNDAKTYLENESKWAACKAWAEKNNAKFFVYTEDTLKTILTRFPYKGGR